jgi:folate-binding protein YgfZ
MTMTTARIAHRARAYVRVAGPEAAEYLERMVSNEVATLVPGEARDALLLTAKARVIAPVRVLRRADEDFLLLTEPELGDAVRTTLLRSRFAAKVEIEPEQHTSLVVFGGEGGIPNLDYGEAAVELLDADPAGEPMPDGELERMRIEAGTPAWGKEIDERVLPAEAGLEATHVSFTKGCYPGQEPIARQHHRGRVNRRLRVLELDDGSTPDNDAEIRLGDKAVGRLTSAVPGLALGYVRVEVPENAELELDSGRARMRPLT